MHGAQDVMLALCCRCTGFTHHAVNVLVVHPYCLPVRRLHLLDVRLPGRPRVRNGRLHGDGRVGGAEGVCVRACVCPVVVVVGRSRKMWARLQDRGDHWHERQATPVGILASRFAGMRRLRDKC